jgi:iron complex outermembrane recepter protein
MKFIFTKSFFASLILVFLAHLSFSQSVVKGKIIDATSGEVLVGATVVLKGTTTGSQTDYDGLFEFKTTQIPPFTLSVSFIGFESKDIEVTDLKNPLSIKLGEETKLIDVVEIKGQRISDKQKAGPLTVESMDKLAIKQTASVSFYEGLGALKGVDMTTASIGFTIINTRGFNSTNPVRSLQIIDGVDNQSPGLNFSLGNFLGSSELDVLKADIIAGASSAYYGPNAFNGVISMETKNPFFQKGLAASVKYGERNLTEGAIRYADAFKNKSGHEWAAFKLNLFYLKAYDWVADNYDSVSNSISSRTNPGGYDAINIYGDETSFNGSRTEPFDDLAARGIFHRTGYKEVDLVDYNTKNLKANLAVHFRLKPSQAEQSPELILSSSYGGGTTVFQGENRFSLRNIQFNQNRIELRKRDKYFIRAYNTAEDAGDSFDPYYAALILQQRAKTNNGWFQDYNRYWQNDIAPKLDKLEFPRLATNNDKVLSDWYAKNADALRGFSDETRLSVDNGGINTRFKFFAPGTPEFQTELNKIAGETLRSSDYRVGGSRLFDQSSLYHVHGEYRFQPKHVNEIVIGGNGRMYRPNSGGTIFSDTNGRKITNSEFGIYAGLEKKFGNDKFKVTATLRMDKNQNFNFLFSPAASFVWQPDKLNFLRISLSSAIRNPTLADQYLNLNVGRAILRGNIEGVSNLVTVPSLLSYFERVILDTTRLERFNIAPIRPEKVKSAEIGYRTTLFDNTYVDMSYYFSIYDDFIGYLVGVEADFTNRFNPNLQAYRYAANSTNTVTTQGFSLGVSHYFAKSYALSGNYSFNQLNTKTDDPIIPAYNTPTHKFNVSISGRDVSLGGLKNVGFNFNYKWIEGFIFSGSPQFSGAIPTYSLLDGQVNYTIPKINMTLKVGASNLLNNKQFQVYGGPRVGRMAYVQLLYDFVKK